MDKQLKKIQKAYDLTIEEYNKGINSFDNIPEKIKNLPGFTNFIKNSQYNIGNPDIKKYLAPKSGMRFFDAGCDADLVNYRLYKWKSTYYGVDISSASIKVMKGFVVRNNIQIGDLYIGELSKLPFSDNFFDISAVIGVLEYYGLEYIKNALQELNRVSKPDAKMVLDIPNQKHPYYNIMLKLEQHFGRPHIPKSTTAFEKILKPLFLIEKVDTFQVMSKYFVRTIK